MNTEKADIALEAQHVEDSTSSLDPSQTKDVVAYLPVIIRGLNYSVLMTQILVVPVFACGAIATVIIGVLSDCYQSRAVPAMFCFGLSAIGYLLLLVLENDGARYGATYLISVGTYAPVVICLSWVAANILGYIKRGLTNAFVIVCGQCMVIMASLEYNTPLKYVKGNAIARGFTYLGLVVSGSLLILLRRSNSVKRKNQRTEEASLCRTKSFEEVCDDHPDFFYVF